MRKAGRRGGVLETVFEDAVEVEYARLRGCRGSRGPDCHFIHASARDKLAYTIRVTEVAVKDVGD